MHKVLKVYKALLAHKVPLALLVQTAKTVRKVLLALPVLPVQRDKMELKVLLVHKAPLVLPVQMELTDRMV